MGWRGGEENDMMVWGGRGGEKSAKWGGGGGGQKPYTGPVKTLSSQGSQMYVCLSVCLSAI